MKAETKAKHAKLRGLKLQRKAYQKSLRILEKDIDKLQKRKMKQGGQRKKGNSNENTLAKIIVAAFAEFGVTNKDCYRTPSSGGHRYAKEEDPGDLVVSKKLRAIFPFSVEAKHYKKVDLYPFLDPEKHWKKSWPVRAWLKQTCAATTGSLIPLLVFRMNNKQFLAALPRMPNNLSWPDKKLTFGYKDEPWVLLRLDKLLRIIVRGEKERREMV